MKMYDSALTFKSSFDENILELVKPFMQNIEFERELLHPYSALYIFYI